LDTNLNIYPNPAPEGKITVEVSELLLNKQIIIYDSMGGILKSFQAKELKTEIQLNAIRKGVYYIGLENKEAGSKRFAVE
jgi:hypothetical protein